MAENPFAPPASSVAEAKQPFVRASRSRLRKAALIVIGVFALDRATKVLLPQVDNLPSFLAPTVASGTPPGPLALAWGTGLLLVLVTFLVRTPDTLRVRWLALTLGSAAASSNLFDRYAGTEPLVFLRLTPETIINVADMALAAAVLLPIVLLLKKRDSTPGPSEPHPPGQTKIAPRGGSL